MENQEHVNELVQTFEGYFEHKDNKDTALVLVFNKNTDGGKGYGLGIATRNEKGYTPTPANVFITSYMQAKEIVFAANEILFKRSDFESYKIVLSTMGK